MRILNVAAFAVSGYASTEGRSCKPFNPLLGETYEADYQDKGIRFFSEKVSTQPIFFNTYLFIMWIESLELSLPHYLLGFISKHS